MKLRCQPDDFFFPLSKKEELTEFHEISPHYNVVK